MIQYKNFHRDEILKSIFTRPYLLISVWRVTSHCPHLLNLGAFGVIVFFPLPCHVFADFLSILCPRLHFRGFPLNARQSSFSQFSSYIQPENYSRSSQYRVMCEYAQFFGFVFWIKLIFLSCTLALQLICVHLVLTNKPQILLVVGGSTGSLAYASYVYRVRHNKTP